MDGTSIPQLDEDGPSIADHDLVRLQEVFVPVHGYVRFYPGEIAIINHPAFQRLRRCRQLGFAHLVFPGAVHTRFEHCLGAVHVAEKMMQYVDANFRSLRRADRGGAFVLKGLNGPTRSLIRLGALLHDIGHIPLGHTLEDELNHLPKHDASQRLDIVCRTPDPEYQLDGGLELSAVRPSEGWSLATLLDSLYGETVAKLWQDSEVPAVTPSAYAILKAITLKPPPAGIAGSSDWMALESSIASVFPVAVARDIVGNTICADFLDYIYRDWYHVGKPVSEDKRLYQYMEVRAPVNGDAGVETLPRPSEHQFIINVGPDQKLRHDALTSIFELLESRYKLAETVIFHRTKLAATALLDRCFLELRCLYESAALSSPGLSPADHLAAQALRLLLQASDDDVPGVIRRLASGATQEDENRLRSHAINFDVAIRESHAGRRGSNQPSLTLVDAVEPKRANFDVRSHQELIAQLASRLERRAIYTLAARLARRNIAADDLSELYPDELPESVQRLTDPTLRHRQIRMLEKRLSLDLGSVAIYAPPAAQMNAKLAEVKLLINNKILPFQKYEEDKGSRSLTGGVLGAQVRRFYELWGVSVYIEREQWHSLSAERKRDLEEVVLASIYLPTADPALPITKRVALDAKIGAVARAARGEFQSGISNKELHEFSGESFVSGFPYDQPLVNSETI